MMASPLIDTDALRRIVQEATTTGPRPVPRIVVSVGNKDGVLFEEASGVKLFAEPPSPQNTVSMDSIFWFASQTKLITSLAGALLVEKGVWTLDSLAEEFVPELKDIKVLEGYDEETGEAKTRTPSTKVTTRHLFTHTAGTKFTMGHPDLNRWRKEHGLETVWHGPKAPRETVAGLPLLWEPGEKFSYAHDNDLLAFAIEGASGMDFEDYCKKYIFEPLGIDDLVWRRGPNEISKQVDLCFRNSAEDGFKAMPLSVVERPLACSGGGGLFGSAKSYMKILRTLLNNGTCPDTGVQLCKKETLVKMTTPLVTDERYLKDVWEYLKHDTPMDSPDGKELDTSRAVGMIVKICQKDIEGGRRKGTFYGEGYANTFWSVDPTTGICTTILTDVAPFKDPGVFEFCCKFERELYRNL